MASASATTSPPAISQISETALIKEILVAKKALAATFTSSAVCKSVTKKGVLSAKGCIHLARQRLCSAIARAHAQHNAVWDNGVLNRVSFAQEFRIPRDFHRGSLRCQRIRQLLQLGSSANWNRGLAENNVLALQKRHQLRSEERRVGKE